MDSNFVQEILDLLAQMVSKPSVDGAEASISDFLTEYVGSMGMTVRQEEVLPDRKNVVAEYVFGSGGKTVLLNSHMDVVDPGVGWDTNPYTLVVKGDRAYGRGATDAKGALACLTIALKHIINNPCGINGRVLYTAVVDEEACSYGARKLCEGDNISADYAIIGEPTLSRVAIGHNGSLRPVISIKGLSAHSSNPEKGINAIRIAAYISHLVDEVADEISKIANQTTGKPSIAITKINGGIKENMLPDSCELVIDRRMVPGEKEEELIKRFERLCQDAQAAFPGSVVGIDHYLVTTGPASEVAPDSKIAQIAYRACELATGEKQAPFGLTCNTDMNHFIKKGIPSVIVGPGTITVAHMPNEYVELSELEKACKADESIIRSLLIEG